MPQARSRQNNSVGDWKADGAWWPTAKDTDEAWWRSQSWTGWNDSSWWYWTAADGGYGGDAVRAASDKAFTGQMCAGQRWDETMRPDAMFQDPLAYKLAGPEGRSKPMGGWILIPRTVYGDSVLQRGYVENNCRQLVLLGAGMDARAWRLQFPELVVYEVDLQSNFDVKENLVAGHPLTVQSRKVVATTFGEKNSADPTPAWVTDLLRTGFRPDVPTVWLLEGLMMYLTIEDQLDLMQSVGSISAKGSLAFHDGISKTNMAAGIRVANVPFLGGSDEYGDQWGKYGGFMKRNVVLNIESIYVDRVHKTLEFDWRWDASPKALHGQRATLFVEVEK